MRKYKWNTRIRVLMAAGLLLTVLAPTLDLPDVLKGFLTGCGMGIELVALAMLYKYKRKWNEDSSNA